MFQWLGRLFSKKATVGEFEAIQEKLLEQLDKLRDSMHVLEHVLFFTREYPNKQLFYNRVGEINFGKKNTFELKHTFCVENNSYEVWIEKDKPTTKSTPKKTKKKGKKK